MIPINAILLFLLDNELGSVLSVNIFLILQLADIENVSIDFSV